MGVNLLLSDARIPAVGHTARRVRGLHFLLDGEIEESLGPGKSLVDLGFTESMTRDFREPVTVEGLD